MKIKNRVIDLQQECYIIAEISHNHQGSGEDALRIIEEAARHGASAVKFQKRDNARLFMKDFYNKPYNGENSFGNTYGEHREFLEPKIEWLKMANDRAHKLGLDFIMTVFDEASLTLCEDELNIDAYKIQSADLTHHPLIKKVAAAGKPYFISCGAASVAEIRSAYELCRNQGTEFCLMYAVSEYPTADERVNLNRITQLKQLLGLERIGLSCHHTGIEPAVLSRSLGVVVIEKHFTLNKDQKGPDHKLSLTPPELLELRDRLKSVDTFMGQAWKNEMDIESWQLDARHKMGKCIVASKNLEKDEIITEALIEYRSPMAGFNPSQLEMLIGKRVLKDVERGEVLDRTNVDIT